MKLINYTPHAVNVIGDNGNLTIPPSGYVARISTVTQDRGRRVVNGVPVHFALPRYGTVEVQADNGEVYEMPQEKEGVGYIVSGVVREKMNRGDTFSPGDLVRDDQGRVIGCRTLYTTENYSS